MSLTANRESLYAYLCGSERCTKYETNKKQQQRKIKITTKITHFVSFRIHKYWISVGEIRFVDLIKSGFNVGKKLFGNEMKKK